MSIRIMKQNLQEALKGLAKVVCGKTTLPILACVRLKSENSTLTISGTDLEQWLDYRVPASHDLLRLLRFHHPEWKEKAESLQYLI